MRSRIKWHATALLAGFLLLAPAAAPAAEFSLGGFVALYTIWDSTQINSNLSQPVARSNDLNNQHGRLKFSSERTRMNFTIKGPEVWGAKTTGFIEWDFDGGGQEYIFNGNPGGGWASPHKARLRVRHMMFKLNWTDTELMLGQYWSLLSEDPPECAKPGTSGVAGMIWHREPQIRLTQKFLGVLSASVALSNPGSGPDSIQIPTDQFNANNPYLGESTETPRVSARLKYEQDLWGKAAFYGAPKGFTAYVAAAWQRLRFRSFPVVANNGRIFGQNGFTAVTAAQNAQQYLDPWVVNGSVFIPILTTQTKNLANTMSLLSHWYIGTGMDLEKEALAANASYLRLSSLQAGTRFGDRQMAKQYGGFVQLQYYFTNQWFANVLWGMNRVYGIDRSTWLGPANNSDPVSMHQQYYATLWYQPVKALKFGMEYTYARTNYFQKIQQGSEISDQGGNHRLLFVGFFFF